MAVLAALWMGVAVACLMVLDIGNLFWQQRELQKVADLSALAGASGKLETACLPNAGAAAFENAKANGWQAGNGTFVAQAGGWQPQGASMSSFFQPGGNPSNACHVEVTRTVPYFFVWPAADGGRRTLNAQATALQRSKQAKLSIRSTLATVTTDQAPILNALVGGLLGGSLDIAAVGWNGLLGTQLDLLRYLDLLAAHANVKAGDYTKLLDTDITVGDLLTVMADAVEQQAGTADVAVTALRKLAVVAANVSSVWLRLGQLIRLQTGADRSALETKVNLFELVQALVQVGNTKHAVQGDVEVPLPGVANVAVRLRVIEPPQLTAIGDPDLAAKDPLGADKLYVRTAQIRLLASVELQLVNGLMKVVNGVLDLLSPVIALLGALTGAGGYMDLQVLPAPARLDISLETGGGQAYVTQAQCTGNAKALRVNVRTAAADIRVGRMGNTAAEAAQNVLGSHNPIANAPIPVLDFACKGCAGTGPLVRTAQYFGGLGIEINTPVAANIYSDAAFNNPPSLKEEMPLWQTYNTRDIVKTLSKTVTSLGDALQPLPAQSGGGLQTILKAIDFLLDQVLKLVGDLLKGVLSPLLDPLLNVLLKALGINLAVTEVGAQLNCGGGAELVY